MVDSTSREFRLLACDLDGTLMGEELVISRRVARSISAAQAKGVFVTIATGRGFQATLPYARRLHIEIPIICYQGGMIKHPGSDELLYQATIDKALFLEVVELAETRDWHLLAFVDDTIFLSERVHSDKFYRRWFGPGAVLVPDLRDSTNLDQNNPSKFLIVADESKCDAIEDELNSVFKGSLDIVRSHRLFVEGNPPHVNKGAALQRLAAHLAVPQTQVMAIGDQGNDVAMLKWAGLGVAMKYGHPAARSVADWVAPPLSEDGAAVAIERFIL
jgi:Cof subfamily protein (haloacid dehalogenase superfamily)